MGFSQAIHDVKEERVRQITIGNDDAFDKTNTKNDWVSYVTAYAGRASDRCARNKKDGQDFRKNMVKVAALAIAAIEAHDKGWC